MCPATPYRDVAVVDVSWDGGAAERKVQGDAAILSQLYAWRDPSADPDTQAAYKLPHHEVTNGEPGPANVNGVRAALAALGGARGTPSSGSPVPAADIAAVRSHLQRHLDKFNQAQERSIPPGDPWIRRAELVDVSYPARQIELIVMPYDAPTTVPWQDRHVTETIARGAFDGIERRANRVNVNREHDRDNTIGRALTFHPARDEGLVADVRISKTTKGDEALELAADGCLDASAGFLPMDGGLRWDSADAYTVTKAWLHHIALTSEPAYPGARVLSVRTTTTAAASGPTSRTPNLDVVRGWLADDRLASLRLT